MVLQLDVVELLLVLMERLLQLVLAVVLDDRVCEVLVREAVELELVVVEL